MVSMLPEIPRNVTHLCEALFNHPASDITRYFYLRDNIKTYKMKQGAYYSEANCSTLQRGFLLEASLEEESFPLAYSILVYKDAEQVYRLLRAIYRPNNYYCLHVDKKVKLMLSFSLYYHHIIK